MKNVPTRATGEAARFRLALSRVVLFGAYLMLELSVLISPDIKGPRT